jgi:arylsulfatase A-like enzyme
VHLIVRFPDGRWCGVKVRDYVSLIDVAPTILDWARVSERLSMDGISLMPLRNIRRLYSGGR